MTAYKNIPAGLENTKNMADKTIIHIVEEPRRKELIDNTTRSIEAGK